MTTFELMSIVGVIIGPLFGAIITLWLQDRGISKERRLNIFRTLMKNRRSWIDPEHVAALNLIEIEYHKNTKLLIAYRIFMASLDDPGTRLSHEQTFSISDVDEIHRRDNAFNDRIYKYRKNLHTKLLSEMAKKLGYKIEQLDILEGGYRPQAFSDMELEQNAIRKFFVELYLGKRSIPVVIKQDAEF